VSKCERGERRIDVIELRAFCRAIGMPLQAFLGDLESAIAESQPLRPRAKSKRQPT
jgi:hypothetical protein